MQPGILRIASTLTGASGCRFMEWLCVKEAVPTQRQKATARALYDADLHFPELDT